MSEVSLMGQPVEHCHADRDGNCTHHDCPQLRDGEPHASGRHCPIDVAAAVAENAVWVQIAEAFEDDDYDDDAECPRCHGDGMDPQNDYLLPCPLCQGEQTP